MSTPTYTLIDSTTLATASNSVNFTSIPSDSSCTDLIIAIDGATASSCLPVMQLNDNLSSIYYMVGMADDAGAGFSQNQTNTSFNPVPGYSVTGKFSAIWQIMDIQATDKHKAVLVRFNQLDGTHVHAAAGRWGNTDAITSVKITTSTGANYSIGTTINLYKIAG